MSENQSLTTSDNACAFCGLSGPDLELGVVMYGYTPDVGKMAALRPSGTALKAHSQTSVPSDTIISIILGRVLICLFWLHP